MNKKIINKVTDEDIVRVFTNTNFGHDRHRELLEASVFKKLLGFHCGHTITTIMGELGLIGKNGRPTKKGRAFTADAYEN